MTTPVIVRAAAGRAVPVIVDSPHSGMQWPDDFAPSAPREAILTTWDAFVDELWGDAPDEGATLIAATFPRAYVDVNRAEDDIDPELLATPWPAPLRPTAYSARGMGLIRRNALPNVPMYAAPLSVAAVERRISNYYLPYRSAVIEHCARAQERFGGAWHLNCHSMKSRGNAMNVDAGAARPDLVVSDRHGSTAAPELTAWVAEWFRAQGLQVRINDPYQGGDLVRSFGAPAAGRHSIQLEINRALYMDEAAFAQGRRFGEVRALCRAFVRAFAARVTPRETP